MNSDNLGDIMARLLDSGLNKFARWAKVFRDVSRLSPAHANTAIDLVVRMLRGDPGKAPRDVGVLFELLFELLSETSGRLTDEQARKYLSALKAGGKAAKLAKQILAMN
jgi:hypothetical protein